jgi:hypothetical protein
MLTVLEHSSTTGRELIGPAERPNEPDALSLTFTIDHLHLWPSLVRSASVISRGIKSGTEG